MLQYKEWGFDKLSVCVYRSVQVRLVMSGIWCKSRVAHSSVYAWKHGELTGRDCLAAIWRFAQKDRKVSMHTNPIVGRFNKIEKLIHWMKCTTGRPVNLYSDS